MSENEPASPGKKQNKAVESVSTLTVVVAIFLAGLLWMNPTWPVVVGVVAIAAMVAVVSYFMLKN